MRLARFVIRYFISSILVLLVYPFTNRSFFQETYNRCLLFFSRIPSVELGDLLPELKASSLDLALCRFSRSDGNVSYGEILALCIVASHLKAKRVFEIGTYNGWTTLQLALNTPEDANIATLDLRKEDMQDVALQLEKHDVKYIDKLTIGDQYKNTRVEKKISQLYGDSATFDFSPFYDSIDLMFIDGSHHYAYVKRDTENALKMIREGGVIIWHDFLVWQGVTDFLLELSKNLKVFHLKDTSLVVYRKKS
jgi:hypothetical protein